MKGLILILLLGLLLITSSQASTMVLIHGFQAKGTDWRKRHVTAALQSSGWVDGGNYQASSQGIYNPVQLSQRPNAVFYTIDLPSQAAIATQAEWLGKYLRTIYQQRDEPLILVGHSAGGVVARYWLVVMRDLPVQTLVTIASPHLGTPLSDLATQLSRTPAADIVNDIMANLGVKPLPYSPELLTELQEERPNTFLYWLNRQPHPNLRYVSVVRDNQQPDQFDFIVPFFSQNMNNVFALNQRAEVWNSQGNHFLNAQDGYLIHRILNINAAR